MPLTIKEHQDSPKVTIGPSDGSVTRRWFARGSEDETAVYVALLAAAGDHYQGFVRRTIKLSRLGGPNWTCEVVYGSTGAGGSDVPTGANGLGGSGPPTPTAPTLTMPLTSGWSFDCTGNTIHINQSRVTYFARRPADGAGPGFGTAPDTKKAIGLTQDGSVEGCDIFAPTLEFTRTVTRAAVTLPYLRTIKNIVGSTNHAEFYTFGIGELLYLGANGRFTQGEGWSITHKFAVGKTELNVDVGGITIPKKRAWDYIWVGYTMGVVGGISLAVPDVVYVERVYGESNYALLEIG